jgi:hypothetical protein
VLEFDRGVDGQLGNLGKKILQKKFQSYNKEWLQAVEQEYAHHGYDYGVGGASGAGARGLSGDNFFNDKVRECIDVMSPCCVPLAILSALCWPC